MDITLGSEMLSIHNSQYINFNYDRTAVVATLQLIEVSSNIINYMYAPALGMPFQLDGSEDSWSLK